MAPISVGFLLTRSKVFKYPSFLAFYAYSNHDISGESQYWFVGLLQQPVLPLREGCARSNCGEDRRSAGRKNS